MKAGQLGTWFWGGLGFAVAICVATSGGVGGVLLGLFWGALFLMPWHYSYSIYKQSCLLDELMASGFAFDYVLGRGNKLVMDKAKMKVAFVTGAEIRQYSFSDISRWEWQWKDVNGVKKQNTLVIDVKDVSKPVLHIQFAGHADEAEQWNSRLELVLQGR